MEQRKIFVIFPCYNEEKNIGLLIEDTLAQGARLGRDGFDLIAVGIDDCSTDNTRQVILDCAARDDRVKLITHKENMGLCGGLNSAIDYFLQNGSPSSLLVIMDGDNTHSPQYIHEMISRLHGGFDCVIASRYRSGADVVGLAAHRAFLSDMAKLYYKVVLNVPNVLDYTCGYRVYTFGGMERLVERFGHAPVKEKSFACMMELLFKLHITGTKFDEVGFVLRYDQKQGSSKMQVLKTMRKSLVTALRLRRLKRRESKNNGA